MKIAKAAALPAVTPVAATVARPERVFPTLTSGQVARMAAHGRLRRTTRGEVLVEVGDTAVPVFVVVRGELQALRPTDRVRR
jgi:thioredoxin reductase (NADPH)